MAGCREDGDGRQAVRRRHRRDARQGHRQELRRGGQAAGGCGREEEVGRPRRPGPGSPRMDPITQLFPWITNGPLIAVQVMSGLSVGMFLFLVSVGMSLIFGVTRIVNLAHGSFYMVSAYLMV